MLSIVLRQLTSYGGFEPCGLSLTTRLTGTKIFRKAIRPRTIRERFCLLAQQASAVIARKVQLDERIDVMCRYISEHARRISEHH
jgi:hypothetical protein